MTEHFTCRDAVIEALDEELGHDPTVFVMGQDVGRMGGNFATTKGLHTKWGDRVRDTPISEDAMVGAALGAAIAGRRPVVEVMFSAFLGCCMDEICNHMSQIYYVSAGNAVPRMTLRTVNVLGRSSGCHHSGRPESWLMHLPGLVVLAPATPRDVKGMLKYAIRSDDPVIFIENAMLYNESGPRGPEGELIGFGTADVVRSGDDVTIITYSGGVRTALAAAKVLALRQISAEVVDLRSLAPLDLETILGSVTKTGRTVVLAEDVRTAGVAAEVVARVTEQAFAHLHASPVRITAADTPVPFAPALEEAITPTTGDVVAAVAQVCETKLSDSPSK
ncbi:MAG: alpha-ketoacid dehydrogenase subunit beta [Streptosporangiales bacterium]|nr:alpha-ketoacid dehydrogenase subunit beta [Streptosporangiales bacterium]